MIDISLLKEGATVVTADMRKRVVAKVDGKYVFFKDGSQFRLRHPDLVEVLPEEEETAPKPKKSRKKKTEEEIPEE